MDLIKKASEIKQRRLKVNEKYGKENKENENDGNRSFLFEQEKKI
jgi:hypothetical protein